MIGCGVVAGVAIIAVIEHNLSVADPGKKLDIEFSLKNLWLFHKFIRLL